MTWRGLGAGILLARVWTRGNRRGRGLRGVVGVAPFVLGDELGRSENKHSGHCDEEDKMALRRLEKEADELIEGWRSEVKLSAVAFAVSVRGELVYEKAFGHTDVENGIEATSGMRVKVASLSKLVAAHCYHQLMEDNPHHRNARYALHQVLGELPTTLHVDCLSPERKADFGLKLLPGENAASDFLVWRLCDNFPIPLRALLHHAAGFHHYYTRKQNYGYRQYRSMTEAFRDSIDIYALLTSPPGESINYTSPGINVLGVALERLQTNSYKDYATSLLCKLGMNDSSFQELDDCDLDFGIGHCEGSNMIPGQGPGEESHPTVGMCRGVATDFSRMHASEGLISTVGDLNKFGCAYARCFVGPPQEPHNMMLSRATVRKVWSPFCTPSQDSEWNKSFGLGWNIFESCTNMVVPEWKVSAHHSGSGLGSMAFLAVTFYRRRGAPTLASHAVDRSFHRPMSRQRVGQLRHFQAPRNVLAALDPEQRRLSARLLTWEAAGDFPLRVLFRLDALRAEYKTDAPRRRRTMSSIAELRWKVSEGGDACDADRSLLDALIGEAASDRRDFERRIAAEREFLRRRWRFYRDAFVKRRGEVEAELAQARALLEAARRRADFHVDDEHRTEPELFAAIGELESERDALVSVGGARYMLSGSRDNLLQMEAMTQEIAQDFAGIGEVGIGEEVELEGARDMPEMRSWKLEKIDDFQRRVASRWLWEKGVELTREDYEWLYGELAVKQKRNGAALSVLDIADELQAIFAHLLHPPPAPVSLKSCAHWDDDWEGPHDDEEDRDEDRSSESFSASEDEWSPPVDSNSFHDQEDQEWNSEPADAWDSRDIDEEEEEEEEEENWNLSEDERRDHDASPDDQTYSSAEDWNSNSAEDWASNSAEEWTSNSAENWTANSAEDWTSNSAEDWTSNSAEDWTSNSVEDWTSNSAEDWTSNSVEDWTSNSAEDWTSNSAQDKAPNSADSSNSEEDWSGNSTTTRQHPPSDENYVVVTSLGNERSKDVEEVSRQLSDLFAQHYFADR